MTFYFYRLGDFYDKIYTPGMVICRTCDNQTVRYGERGSSALKDHATSKKHMKKYQSTRKTPRIDQHFFIPPREPSSIGTSHEAGNSQQPTVCLPALMCDRTSTAEVNILMKIYKKIAP